MQIAGKTVKEIQVLDNENGLVADIMDQDAIIEIGYKFRMIDENGEEIEINPE